MRQVATVLFALSLVGCGAAPAVTRETTTVSASPAPEEPPPPPRLLDEEEAARTYAQAMQVHVRANELRSQCVDGDDPPACDQAQQLYGLAADTWRALVDGRPGNETAEWIYMLSQALFQSGRFEAAAEAADRYLSTGATEWRSRSAALLLEARERAWSESGVRLRDEAPSAQGDPPEVRPMEMPPPVQRLVDARARALEVMTELGEDASARRSLALTNALVLYRYGHWERAQPMLRALLDEGCAGPGAWDGGATAWRTLRAIAQALGRFDAVQALGEEVERRSCDFGAPRPTCGPASEHPRCLARADRVAWRLRGGMQFLERARGARGAEVRQLATRAAEAFLAALEVEGELDARGRITALVEAVRAFRMANDMERAASIDARIVRETDPRAFDEGDRAFAIGALGAALDRQLEAALEARDSARVVDLSPRIVAPDLDIPELADARARARAALPEALVALGRHADASRAYAALATAASDPAARREAELRAALALVPARGCAQAVRPLRAFVTAQREQEGAQDAVVRALWQLVECARPGSREHASAIDEVVQAGERGGLGDEARQLVARATFLVIDRDFDAVTQIQIVVPPGENIEDLAGNLREQLAAPSERVRELLEAYARVERFGIGPWAVAARQRSGAALEALDRAIGAARWELPNDLTSQRRTLNAATFAQIQRITERRAAEILRSQAVPIRCRAAAYYQRAIEMAGVAAVESEEVRLARERLAALELPDRCPR